MFRPFPLIAPQKKTTRRLFLVSSLSHVALSSHHLNDPTAPVIAAGGGPGGGGGG